MPEQIPEGLPEKYQLRFTTGLEVVDNPDVDQTARLAIKHVIELCRDLATALKRVAELEEEVRADDDVLKDAVRRINEKRKEQEDKHV